MRLAVLALVGGLALAAALGGRLAHLPAGRIRRPALVLLAVILYWIPPLADLGRTAALALVLCAYIALLAFAAANLRLVGMPVVALGLSLNAAVILVNAGMPVDPAAMVVSGVAEPDDLGRLDLGPIRQWQADDDLLAGLRDMIPVALLDEVVSFGDLILAAGLADVGFRLLRPLAGRRASNPGPHRRAGRDRPSGRPRPRQSAARLSPAR